MGKLRINSFAVYRNYEFKLCDNIDDKKSEWELFSSIRFKNVDIALKYNFKKCFRYDSCNGHEVKVECYYLPITPSQVESAYEIKNFCEYKGKSLHCEYRDEEKKFRINMLYEDESLYPKLGLTEAFERVRRSNGYDDAGMILEIPDNEIPNVWEEHLPIKGFPFKGPEKVWMKKDGVWLR